MNVAQLVYSLNGKRNLGHVEAGNVLREDLVLDQHRHQVAARQKLHEHVEEGRVLEGGVQLDHPGAVGLGQDVALRTNVCQLIFLKLNRQFKRRLCQDRRGPGTNRDMDIVYWAG